MFSRFFKNVKNTLNKIVSDPEDDIQEQKTKSAHKHYTQYSLADIFPFKIYLVKEGEKDIVEISKKLGVECRYLKKINDVQDGGDLFAGLKLIVPNTASQKHCKDLTVLDLRNFKIEKMMMSDSKMPTFFVYYCTVGGDILGKLMFTDHEIIFEPLNNKLKGFYNYPEGNFDQNTKMGFILNYRDILGTPTKIFSPDPDTMAATFQGTNEVQLIYHVQVDLFQTGFITDMEVLGSLRKLRGKNKSLASFCLKVNRKNLLNETLENEEREIVAEKILALVIKGKKEVMKLKENEQSYTNIPCFDINFRAILQNEKKDEIVEKKVENEDEEEQKENVKTPETMPPTEEPPVDVEAPAPDLSNPEEKEKEVLLTKDTPPTPSPKKPIEESLPTLCIEEIRENWDNIKKYFGARDKIRHVEQMNNQSMQPLDFIFPEIEKTDEEIIHANDTVLDKSNKISVRHNVKILDFDPNDLISNEKFGESKLLTTWMKATFEEKIPSYITAPGWKLLYERTRDGTSYNTLLRKCREKGELFILARDFYDNVFGGYYSQSFEFRDDFYGTGESFLFKITKNSSSMAIYGSTMENFFFCYSDSEGFGMGSDEHFGLFIDKTLVKGSSHCCKTYANAILSDTSHFSIKELEIFGFPDENDVSNI